MHNEPEYLEVIIRYLNNPEDEKLQSELLSFRSESAEHENYFLELEKVWVRSAQSATLHSIDFKHSVKQFKNTLTNSTGATHGAWYWLGRIAAVIALALSGLWIYKSSTEQVYIVKATQHHQMDTVALPDGSQVVLSENSAIKYSDKFNKNQRNLSLTKGKAFFTIKKDADHPFKVELGESEVLVVGTSFNINLTTQQIDLDVKTGKVIFSPYKDGASSVLTKGQALSYNIQRKQLTTRVSQNADAWLTKELIFVDTPLDEVCKQLGAYYNINIRLKDGKGSNKKLNATFTNQSLENVLALLNETYNIEIKKGKSQIILINP